MIKAVFLDRDGVINDNTRHVNKPQDLIIYSEAKKGMKKLFDAGYELFVVTNQGGIELGYITHDDLKKIHDKMQEELKPYCEIKDIRYCPDFKRKSTCRKPKPGMILELADKYNVDLKKSWMVGDMDTDILAGTRAGCKTAKIGDINPSADINGKNLLDIANKILEKDN
ncbi:D-glycero-alpha-D-manno-heptose-1,7-bisphosphate 7-phosphatase [Caldisalinibacter kiritimatiensis]|uniref:D,D-heptose 1,7-bisphosphate phosphatase n=1 Tax=Caldisalinibacter kiritimatiensis TaxID=1304284 RepID=R1CM04_9FIRM|nr:HAD family hydrolase [Caldisalinibacter kiritimatiensis]EOC99740.1 D-glycero-D-manno-heptose 1,7-bisphosphate phosphatase [Caldisalinibacter kiritimatiensis]